LAKEEDEERYVGKFQNFSKGVQRGSKVVKKSFLNASQGLAFIDSSCLVKKSIGRVRKS